MAFSTCKLVSLHLFKQMMNYLRSQSWGRMNLSSQTRKFSDTASQFHSKRCSFRAIVPDSKIVAHLDDLHLGYCSRRKVRVAIAKKYTMHDRIQSKNSPEKARIDRLDRLKPFPFKRAGQLMLAARNVNDIKEFSGDPPEVAVIGRSNVGKSTLLNELLGFDSSFVQKSAVSSKPGETRNLHFYSLGVRKVAHSATQRNDAFLVKGDLSPSHIVPICLYLSRSRYQS